MSRATVLLLAVLGTLLLAVPAHAVTKAGIAVKDATWHVGASAGQFTDDTGPMGTDKQGERTFDPHLHTTKKRISDGVALKTSTRALVMQDGQGDKVAIVSTDLYLPQDFLVRRVAGILAQHDLTTTGPKTGITYENLAVTASHNHMTPYYSTPGWGTAIFQDVFDLRFFEYMAQQMASAVITANKSMVPVRMGGATRTFDAIQSHTYGPQVGDDGTPAGQPRDHTTRQLSVVALEDVTDPRRPRPFANWVVFGVHPEYSMWGSDLINGDITHAAARMVDRELQTTSLFTQRETGASGPHNGAQVHAPETRRDFHDEGTAQMDRAARLLADAITATLKDIKTGTPERKSAHQPWTSDFDIATASKNFLPPATRPYPGVSNCNTASLFHGDPRLPILGLPDCARTNNPPSPAPKELGEPSRQVTAITKPLTSPMYEQLKEAGVPVPESYSGAALTAVEEQNSVHMMAIKLGGIAVTVCPCEQFTDTALNIESRLDKVEGNLWKGWDWTAQKTPAGRDWCVVGGTGSGQSWTCADPRNPRADLAPISDLLYRRMRAQINNDAKGWETDLATLGSEAEPADPAKIKGNFTHEEFADKGYNLVLAVGMGNDYWGYTPEYRDMRAFDHYRKALNGLGPHGADFLATRLSRMAAGLNGSSVALTGLETAREAVDVATAPEQARAFTVANGLGELARAYTPVYEATLPADGGTPGATDQPADVERFGAAHFAWIGGSNYTDLPDVRVERLERGQWRTYGDMHGDVQLMVDFPKFDELPAYRQGAFQWRWTAAFEAFSSDVRQPDARGTMRRSTPGGTFRFVVEGKHRGAQGAAPTPYSVTSEPFRVSPWRGVPVEDFRVDPSGTVSFSAPAFDYPRSYTSPFRYIKENQRTQDGQFYCRQCTFRPWALTGEVERAEVRFRHPSGTERTVEMQRVGTRFVSKSELGDGWTAVVEPGAVQDAFGNTNGSATPELRR
jgi:hypothetical protein